MNPAWESLSIYRSRDVAARRFQEFHGRDLSASKADEFVAALSQGTEYFRSARAASPLVQPLLQYYGVLALSRALILFVDVAAREATLKPQHGLSAIDWSQQLSSAPTSIDQLKALVTKGTLADMVAATKNFRQFECSIAPRPNRITVWQQTTPALLDMEIGLKDCLARIPSLQKLYVECLGEAPACFEGEVFMLDATSSGHGFNCGVSMYATRLGLPDGATLEASLSLPSGAITFGRSPSDGGTMASYDLKAPTLEELVPLFPPVSNDPSGKTFIVMPLRGGAALNELALLYAMAYIVGMLVRYYPRTWTALLGRQKGDVLVPLIESAGRAIDDLFPVRVVQVLAQDKAFSKPV